MTLAPLFFWIVIAEPELSANRHPLTTRQLALLRQSIEAPFIEDGSWDDRKSTISITTETLNYYGTHVWSAHTTTLTTVMTLLDMNSTASSCSKASVKISVSRMAEFPTTNERDMRAGSLLAEITAPEGHRICWIQLIYKNSFNGSILIRYQ